MQYLSYFSFNIMLMEIFRGYFNSHLCLEREKTRRYRKVIDVICEIKKY